MSSKKINCFFNAPYLGGAERSFIHQCKDLRELLIEQGENPEFKFIIPFLNHAGEDKKLSDLIVEKGFSRQQIVYFNYHRRLFGLGRAQMNGLGLFKWLYIVLIPYYCWTFIATLQNLNRIRLNHADIWWVGGNKIGPIAFVLAFFQGHRGRLLWHFRDYLSFNKIFFSFWQIIQKVSTASVEFIGNSYDVSESIKDSVPEGLPCWTLYNPIGDIKFSPSASQKSSDFTLSTASMFAPWKGVHFLVQFACMFEKELRELGITQFNVYGDEIYKTNGDHSGYKQQLHQITTQYKTDFVHFRGLKKPQDVFDESDIFIHGALRPEPFGRVLIESYRSGTPLISTGLGGSGELIDNESSALTFIPYDYYGLYECVSRMCSDDRFSFIQEGRLKGDDINLKYNHQLAEIF